MRPTDHDHWQAVYERPIDGLSWTRASLDHSLQLLKRHGLAPASRVIDIGGGASTLVDDLLNLGVSTLTVLDLAESALSVAKARLAERAVQVDWRAGDLRDTVLPEHGFDLWHDRAVAHFLVDAADEAAYARQVDHALSPGGTVIMAGFAPDGPERCSGLPVKRRNAADMLAMLGADRFTLIDESFETHTTPAGRGQHFCYGVFRKR